MVGTHSGKLVFRSSWAIGTGALELLQNRCVRALHNADCFIFHICDFPMTSIATVFKPVPPSLVPVSGSSAMFPLHRIYCVGRNYEAHAREMGFSSREAPFFFMKPGDAVLPGSVDEPAVLPYPPLTGNLHHEVELVVAIGRGGQNIPAANALQHVFGYAVGLDMTRRDLQNELRQQGRPWCIAKGFESSAPIGAIVPAEQAGDVTQASIRLLVNGQVRQQGNTGQMIWNVAEIIATLSQAWTLQPGDLIYTGTPEGVGPVARGDVLQAEVQGLAPLHVRVA